MLQWAGPTSSRARRSITDGSREGHRGTGVASTGHKEVRRAHTPKLILAASTVTVINEPAKTKTPADGRGICNR